MIKVSWYMKKHKKFDSRLGVFDEKSNQWIDKKGDRCFCFWDIEKKRYTTAVNPFIEKVA
jgi:hypothetical protein